MSENLNKLYTIIQINGDMETDSKPNNLNERELFVNKSGDLYVGIGGNKYTKINANKSDQSISAKNLNGEKFNINNDSGEANLNGLSFNEKVINADDDIEMNNFSLNRSKFTDGEVLKLNNLTLIENQMWGTTFPTNPEPGQVFFKISSASEVK